MFSEAQAKNMRCCGGRATEDTSCVANKCMAWRWSGRHIVDPVDKWKSPAGFCGLAGLPDQTKPE